MNMHISTAAVAAATPAAAPSSRVIAARAMLAGLKIKQWSGRKLDAKVTAETNRAHGATADAGRYNKALVSRDALAEIVAIANRARKEHYARTLPWADDGARILPAAAYLDFMNVARELRTEFDAAVAKFVSGYGDFRDAAKVRLNGMFDAADYPPPDAIAARFGFDVGILPMPDAADFRVDVGDAEADRIRADIQARTDAAIRDAMGDCFTRVCEAVGNMADKLAADRTNEKGETVPAIFRDSLVENVRELAGLLPALNITGNAALAAVADRMAGELLRYDADDLRTDAGARKRTAEAAAAILADAKAGADALAHVSDFMA